jgi:hypothetical protein
MNNKKILIIMSVLPVLPVSALGQEARRGNLLIIGGG